MVVKHLFKSAGMIDASQGFLSSYAVALLLITFLQIRGVVPNFQAPDEQREPLYERQIKKVKGRFKTVEFEVDFEYRADKIEAM